ncbi:hypothetical protein niasHT_038058 [Heterodera trifolii]|uniref:Secreted protein n=1 Tax=Heterodera trifolii TaxID=157864 RepID=A0ABD2HQQ0_9BILA
MCQNYFCCLFTLFFSLCVLFPLVDSRPQLLNSVSTTGLLIGKGSEVKSASVPILSEPILEIHSHSAPVSPSELNFSRRRRKRISNNKAI